MFYMAGKVYYIRKDKFSCPKVLEDCNITPGCLLSECTEFIKSLEEKFYMTLRTSYVEKSFVQIFFAYAPLIQP